MTIKIRKLITIFLTLTFCLTLSLGQLATHAHNGGAGVTEAVAEIERVTGLIDALGVRNSSFNSSVLKNNERGGLSTLIVRLSGDTLLEGVTADEGYLASPAGKAAARAVENAQNAFLKRLKSHGVAYSLVDTYDTVVNAVAIRADVSLIPTIRAISGVEGVYASETYSYPETVETVSSGDNGGTLASAVVNKTNVYGTGIYDSSEIIREHGYSGKGMVVAVLDTGLDYTHDAFQTLPPTATLGLTKAQVAEAASATGSAMLSAVSRGKERGVSFTANELYVSDKVPFAFDYADNDADVYPSYSSHGVHVAGIIAGQDDHYTDKDGNTVNEQFVGVAPDAQLVICKTFTDDLESENLGGAVTEDLIAALDDCVKLGVDVINMSLGSSAGFSDQTDADPEGALLNEVYSSIQEAGISLICAASNDFSSGYGGSFGTNLASNPDSATVGSPSTYAAAVSVASINGKKSDYILANEGLGEHEAAIFFEESSDENSVAYDFAKRINERYPEANGTFEYVLIKGVGKAAEYTRAVTKLLSDKSKPRLVLVQRGDSTFKEKVEIAMEMGAAGIIVYNNVAGKIKMNLGEIEDPIPAISVTYEAGVALYNGAQSRDDANDSLTSSEKAIVGTIRISDEFCAGPFMSDFSSWGCTPDLKLKPEITAHGGEITSTVAGGYDEYSGTSMAAPNMAGFTAILREYVKERFAAELTGTEVENNRAITRITNQLMMSTATTALDEDSLPYSPRKQGAGLASLADSIATGALIVTDNEENDYRPKLELGEGERDQNDGLLTYTGSFEVRNFSSAPLTFTPDVQLMTESLSIDGLAVAEQAYMLEGIVELTANGAPVTDSITVAARGAVSVNAVIKLTAEDEAYITETFENGMFAEGFIKLISADSNPEAQCDLVIPFLGFCGDWSAAPMLDYSVFELAEFEQDSSIDDNEKPKAQVWATQAFSSYYNNEYILPMGTYLYEQDEFDDPMYANEEYCSVSRYNNYVMDTGEGNYMTSTRLHAVYAGLLRNAREVSYTLTDATTGEVIIDDKMYDVSKAMMRGGSAIPANVELKIVPVDHGLEANGKYTMSFQFRMDYDDGTEVPEENTFTFSFYVDYEAPILQDVRVRYYDYTEGNKQKQRIYLDLDVFDNHYAQSVMLCYLDGNELKLVTDYITPVRNANKNGTTTVSIEVTDIYDKYNGELYVQVDDYSLNYNVYKINTAAASSSVLPDEFEVAGDKSITLGVYESARIALSYEGSASLSNFSWNYDSTVVSVKNGTVVGIAPGSTSVRISNGKKTEVVKVTVVESDIQLSKPSLSFGIVRNADDGLQKAEGLVEVNPGDEFLLRLEPDPWYYPMDTLEIEWSSSNDKVATVSQTGQVTALKKGTAIINAVIKGTSYSAGVTLRVRDEFTVSNFTLTKYEGLGGRVVIPTDRNILYIGEEAFENNTDITEIILPKGVIEIHQRAFIGCTSLKAVYFIEDAAMDVADADLTLISYSAFEGCTSLELFDMSNLKKVTVGVQAFKDCTSLSDFGKVKATGESAFRNVGTAYALAFAGCTSIKEIDISGLHVADMAVFTGCTALESVKTGRYTAIGYAMFSSCVNWYVTFDHTTGQTVVNSKEYPACLSLKNITLKTPNIGDYAFNGCTSLAGVVLENPTDAKGNEIPVEFVIGNGAFAATSIKEISFDGVTVRGIGDQAFSETDITKFTMPKGLESIGHSVFEGTPLTELVINDEFDVSQMYTEHSPFAGCSLEKVTAPEDSELYSSVNGVLYSKDKNTLVLYPSASTANLIYEVIYIADGAFYGCDLVETIEKDCVGFTNGMELLTDKLVIGDYAFAGCKNLTKVDMDGVAGIGVGAFSGCTSLTEIVGTVDFDIPDRAFEGCPITQIATQGVTAVGESAFEGCSQLVSFTGSGITHVGARAFKGCTKLAFDDGYTGFNGVTYIGAEAFSGCKSLRRLTFGKVDQMGDRAFYNSTITHFGSSGTVIGRRAFDSVYSLESVSIPEVTVIEEMAFYNTLIASVDCSPVSVGTMAFAGCGLLKDIDLSNAVSIGYLSFTYTALESVDLSSAEVIGIEAFGETPLKSVEFGAGDTPLVIEGLAFTNTRLVSVNLPARVAEVGLGAFGCNERLEGITAEDGGSYFSHGGVLYKRLTEDGRAELTAYPTGLEQEGNSFTVPEQLNVVSIGSGSFYGLASGLKEIILPHTVKAIGDMAFYQSGIITYEFLSMEAPVLLYQYNSYGEEAHTDALLTYTGQHNANFESFIVDYYGKDSGLTAKYPANAKGYDNLVYSLFFSERITTGIHMEDYTRAAKAAIDGLKTAGEIEGWLDMQATPENVEKVTAFASSLSAARTYFNNVTDPTQQAFLTEGSGEKLSALETLMRQVKKNVGIPVTVRQLNYKADYIKDYKEGDVFDVAASGLKLVVEYDDGSVADYDGDITLITTAPLTVYNRYVKVSGRVDGADHEVTVSVSVTPAAPEPENPPQDSSSSTQPPQSSEQQSSSITGEDEKGLSGGAIAGIAIGAVALVVAAAAVVMIIKKKNK